MYSMPVFDMIEAAFRAWGWTRNKLITRLLMRTLYVAFTCFVAVTLPFFGGKGVCGDRSRHFVPAVTERV